MISSYFDLIDISPSGVLAIVSISPEYNIWTWEGSAPGWTITLYLKP